MTKSIVDINKEFVEFEKREGLFDLLIQGYKIWPDIRRPIYLQILEKCVGFDNISSQPAMGIYIWFLRALVYFFFRNPLRKAKETDLLVWSHQRRSLQGDGLYWDIYTDPVIDVLSAKYKIVAIEDSFNGRHFTPAKTKNLLYADILTALAVIKKRKIRVSFEQSERDELDRIEKSLRQQFGVDFGINEIVKNNLRNKAAYVPLYRKMLSAHSPRAVILVCSYGKESLIEACKAEGIPVAEIQHGIIGPGHFGYSFAGIGDKPNFPDYLFTFGEYWKKNVRFSIADQKVFSFGFPFLTMRAANIPKEKKNIILFISQETIGRSLIRFALEMRDKIPAKYEIAFKLHPRETERWRVSYPDLVNSGITVIDTNSPSLYELMAESKWLFGVYSTAIYEGLYFDCDVFIVKLPGYELFLPLVESGTATLIEEPGEFSIDAEPKKYQGDEFFDPDWLANLNTNIDRILHDG